MILQDLDMTCYITREILIFALMFVILALFANLRNWEGSIIKALIIVGAIYGLERLFAYLTTSTERIIVPFMLGEIIFIAVGTILIKALYDANIGESLIATILFYFIGIYGTFFIIYMIFGHFTCYYL